MEKITIKTIMTMAPQELMKPRYKVIADFPLRGIGIGTVLTPEDETSCFVLEDGIMPTDLTRYPNLFKKLEWHEEIKPEDMPEYVKLKDGEVLLTSKWGEYINHYDLWADQMSGIDFKIYNNLKTAIPATVSEYNDYIKSKQSA